MALPELKVGNVFIFLMPWRMRIFLAPPRSVRTPLSSTGVVNGISNGYKAYILEVREIDRVRNPWPGKDG